VAFTPVAAVKEKMGNVKERRYSGLCSTCEKASRCTFPRDPRRPVRHCDEFDGGCGPSAALAREERELGGSPAAAAGTATGGTDKCRYKGLCKTCELLPSCTYPKPEGGVWHCDEYK